MAEMSSPDWVTLGVPTPNGRVAMLIADAFTEFLHQEGARERPDDFAGWLIQHLVDAGYTLVESGAELEPAVKAIES
jgi:hypothetical protein